MENFISERIRQIMEDRGVSPSAFADAIDVQRSSISHILSGRNKPSLDLIQKILNRYSDINPTWLLTGKGKMKQLSLFGEDEPVNETVQEDDKKSFEGNSVPEKSFPENESLKAELPYPKIEEAENSPKFPFPKNEPQLPDTQELGKSFAESIKEANHPIQQTPNPSFHPVENPPQGNQQPPNFHPIQQGNNQHPENAGMYLSQNPSQNFQTPPQNMPVHQEAFPKNPAEYYSNFNTTQPHPFQQFVPPVQPFSNPANLSQPTFQQQSQPMANPPSDDKAAGDKKMNQKSDGPSGEKKVEKVIIFYSDKTFSVYQPE